MMCVVLVFRSNSSYSRSFVWPVETLLCISVWQPTAGLDSCSYPLLFSPLFLFSFFLSPRESKNITFQIKLCKDKVSTFCNSSSCDFNWVFLDTHSAAGPDFFILKACGEKNVHCLEWKFSNMGLMEQWWNNHSVNRSLRWPGWVSSHLHPQLVP